MSKGGSRAKRLYGLHAVRRALEGERDVKALWVQRSREDARLAELVELAERRGVVVRPVTRRALDDMAGGARHQGVVAECGEVVSWSEADLDARLDTLGEAPLLVALDGVQDPHNLGACLRTADAAGAHAVVAPRDRAADLTPAACKVAAGAAESVPFVRVTNLARTLRGWRERGIWLAGAVGEQERSLYELDLDGPLALVLGGEQKGLRRLTRESCDVLFALPMSGVVESLNVSVATGIALYEAVRQRTRIQQVRGSRS